MSPTDISQYVQVALCAPLDVCVTNPPFGKGRPELHHLRRALDMLGPGARLGAIMPNSLQFRQDPATTALRTEREAPGAIVTENPYDAFRASGAMVRTVSVSLTKGAPPC